MDIHKHPLLAEFTGLMHDIEALGASPELTAVGVKAGELRKKLETLLDEQCLTPLPPEEAAKLDNLKPHERQLIIETQQLSRRIRLLQELASKTCNGITPGDRRLMMQQGAKMGVLLEVMTHRVGMIDNSSDQMVVYRGYQPSAKDPLGQNLVDIAIPLTRFNAESIDFSNIRQSLRVMTRAELDAKYPSMLRM